MKDIFETVCILQGIEETLLDYGKILQVDPRDPYISAAFDTMLERKWVVLNKLSAQVKEEMKKL